MKAAVQEEQVRALWVVNVCWQKRDLSAEKTKPLVSLYLGMINDYVGFLKKVPVLFKTLRKLKLLPEVTGFCHVILPIVYR